MKFKMTKGMHAKRILCLGLAAAMAMTSVQIAPITVEAKMSTADVNAGGDDSDFGKGLLVDTTKKYSASETIFNAAEMGHVEGITAAPGEIRQIKLTAKNPSTSTATLKLKVYMKNVASTDLANPSSEEDVKLTSDNVVFEKTVEVASGENSLTLTLNTPFAYDGTNLLFAVENEMTTALASDDAIEFTEYAYDDSDVAQRPVKLATSNTVACDLTKAFGDGITSSVDTTGRLPLVEMQIHIHNIKNEAANPATLTAADGTARTEGNIAYYYCTETSDGSLSAEDANACKQYYFDAEMTQKTTLNEIKFEAYRVAAQALVSDSGEYADGQSGDDIFDVAKNKYAVEAKEASDALSTANLKYDTKKTLVQNYEAIDAIVKVLRDKAVATDFAEKVATLGDNTHQLTVGTEDDATYNATDIEALSVELNQTMSDAQKGYVKAATRSRLLGLQKTYLR